MIRTGQNRVPWHWVLLMSLPFGMASYLDVITSKALPFTLRKFIQSPAWISFITSWNPAFNILVAAIIAWKSDRIWTRFGRRKPFIVIGLGGLIFSLFAVAFSKSLWTLIPAILGFQFFLDFGYTGPWNPLYMDTIPACQRGRGMVINRYAGMLFRMFFMLVLIGRFTEPMGSGMGGKLDDALRVLAIRTLTGEQIIYLAGALLAAASLVMAMLNVHEEKPVVNAIGETLSLFRYAKEAFGTSEKRWLCALVAASVLMSTKLGSLQPLLFTEQFGYSKHAMGIMHSVNMMINMLIVFPVMALLVDWINRYRVFLVCVIISTLHPLVYWLYVRYVAPNSIPSREVIIGFQVADAVFDHAAMIALWPLLFDRIQESERGTMTSAFLVVTSLIMFMTTNLMGLWVSGYTRAFGAPQSAANTFDYMSGYLLIFLVGLIATAITITFGRRKDSKPISARRRQAPCCALS